MLSEEISYPFEGGIYPSTVAPSSHPARISSPLAGIRILLSKETVYPFANGFYPAVRKTLVENAQLSGALKGLDRVKELESASVPQFRFGFPFFLEVDSSASTREVISVLLSGSQALEREDQPLTLLHVLPARASTTPQPIRILPSSSSSYPITSEDLYPTPPPRSVKTVGSKNSRHVGSEEVVASRSSKPAVIRIMLSDKITYPFANGIYPPVRRILAENGELSGALEGLDRIKETQSPSVPLFRFNFPFYLEVESSTPTRESPPSFPLARSSS